MILQIIEIVIMLALLVGSFMLLTDTSDRSVENGNEYAWYGFMMMFMAIVTFNFLAFGPNGILDDSSDNATEVPSVNVTPTTVQK